MENIVALVAVTGGLLGVLAFVWQALTTWRSELQLHVAVERSGGKSFPITVRTSLENAGLGRKRLDYAMLLIAPEHELTNQSLLHFAQDPELGAWANLNLSEMRRAFDKPRYAQDESHAIIPLPFYHREQQTVGRQHIAYRCVLDAARLKPGHAYAVKFFVLEQAPPLRRLRVHVTQDLLALERE
ncbi:MAG: hypothetical protein HY741_00420 [Chloroflexi bacterium]|nr:hypothetical protein [Chloroflexota bacterium]